MSVHTSINSNSSSTEEHSKRGPVLFLISTLDIGGSERKTVRIANELYRRGWNIHLAYLNAPTTLLDRLSKGLPVTCLGRKGKLSFTAIRALHSYIRREEITRIVCVNLYPLIYASAARSLLWPRRRPPVVLMVNTTEYIGLKARTQMLLYRHLVRHAQNVIFGCDAQLKLWRDRYVLRPEICSVIYNGVDETKFAPGKASVKFDKESLGVDLEDSDFVIGAVGQLRSEKNHIELITALAKLKDTVPSAKLVIVGGGEERERLVAATKANGLNDRVSLPGQYEDVRPILKRMDVFVLPSVSETFSNAALEAMSMGKTVILTDTGGAREMLQNGVNGFFYKSGNTDFLVSLVEQLATNPETIRSIGKRARETVLERFSFTRMACEYEQMLS